MERRMNVLRHLGLWLTVLAIYGCSMAALATIRTRHDKFEGHTITKMAGNELPSVIGFLGSTVELNPIKIQTKDGLVSYSLLVHYGAKNWLFIESGESLILLIDGEPVGLQGEGSINYRDVRSAGVVVERAMYDVDLELLKRIANAEEVKVKIKGSKSYIERSFSQTNFRNFQKFVSQYSE